MPSVKKIRESMLKHKIPNEIIEQFDFTERTGNNPEPVVALIDKMDELLTHEQCLLIMGEQGCCKAGKRDKDCKAFAKEHAKKTIEEKLKLFGDVEYMMLPQMNGDDTFTITMSGYQNGAHTGKTTCSCGMIKKLKQPFTVSPTYCGCCAGHFRYHYQNMLGVPIKLKEIISSPLNTNGEQPCQFLFEIQHKPTLDELTKYVPREHLTTAQMFIELAKKHNLKEQIKYAKPTAIDLIAKLAKCEYENEGIAYFVPKSESDSNKEWADKIIRDGWIARNFNSSKAENAISDEIGRRIAEHGGTILEIGAGPGGGFMPYVLKANPEATVIISDISPTIVSEWKRFLDRELNSPEIYYAAFNFCNIPFKDDCIDVISDGGGIGNTERGTGTKGMALKEAYRVLKPGGLLITSTGFVNKETLGALTEDVEQILKDKRPDIFEDLYEETVLAGFKKIDSVINGSWDTDNDDSDIADLARSIGVNLRFTSYIRYCQK